MDCDKFLSKTEYSLAYISRLSQILKVHEHNPCLGNIKNLSIPPPKSYSYFLNILDCRFTIPQILPLLTSYSYHLSHHSDRSVEKGRTAEYREQHTDCVSSVIWNTLWRMTIETLDYVPYSTRLVGGHF